MLGSILGARVAPAPVVSNGETEQTRASNPLSTSIRRSPRRRRGGPGDQLRDSSLRRSRMKAMTPPFVRRPTSNATGVSRRTPFSTVGTRSDRSSTRRCRVVLPPCLTIGRWVWGIPMCPSAPRIRRTGAPGSRSEDTYGAATRCRQSRPGRPDTVVVIRRLARRTRASLHRPRSRTRRSPHWRSRRRRLQS